MQSNELRSIYLQLRNVHDLSLRYFGKKTATYDLTPTQFGILRCIPLHGLVNMTDLIRQVGCAPSNMTSIIQRMDRDMLVTTRKNPSDNRETLVSLTDKGQNLRHELEPVYQEFLEESYGHLTEEERTTFLNLLSKLEEGLANK